MSESEAELRPVVTVFRSRLRGDADGYGADAAHMLELAQAMPGFVDFKSFSAEDGERVSIVVFDSAESHRAWRDDLEHLQAQRRGRDIYYDQYQILVCEQIKEASFVRDPDGVDPAIAAVLVSCRASHRRLLEGLQKLDDAAARRPSLLAGWSVGHVLTHLARNAESYVGMMEAAMAGDAVQQYPGGRQQRESDIEAGAARRASELRADVQNSIARLEATWAAMTPEAWGRHGLRDDYRWPCRQMPFHRWREVEVHHVDLGLGYDVSDWPDEYVQWEFGRSLGALPERITDDGERRAFLAWLIGRTDQPSPIALASWQLKPEYYFR